MMRLLTTWSTCVQLPVCKVVSTRSTLSGEESHFYCYYYCYYYYYFYYYYFFIYFYYCYYGHKQSLTLLQRADIGVSEKRFIWHDNESSFWQSGITVKSFSWHKRQKLTLQ